MLNPYFAFGVPCGLLILYGIFAIVRKKTKITYLGFALFIISGFMAAFCFQILQYAYHERARIGEMALEQQLAYPLWTLFIGLAVGLLLAAVNIFRGYRRIKGSRGN